MAPAEIEFNVTIFWDAHKCKILYRTNEPLTIGGYQIPAGYVTDFATTPRLVWPLFPPVGRHNPAALVHDYLYDNKLGTRRHADEVFLRVMLEYGVNLASAYIMFYAVRIGGRKWWKN